MVEFDSYFYCPQKFNEELCSWHSGINLNFCEYVHFIQTFTKRVGNAYTIVNKYWHIC